MKRFSGFLAVMALVLGSAVAQAASQSKQSDAAWVNYKTGSVTTSTAAIVVDISNPLAPHPGNAAAHLVGFQIEVDKVAAGTATVKLGVVTSVNASSGTISWFYTKGMTLNVSNTTNADSFNFFPADVNAYVSSGGTTPFLATNESVTLSDTEALEYQSDVALPVPSGSHVPPARGDIIFRVIGGGSNAAIGSIKLRYYTTP